MCISVYLRESAANHKISFQPYQLEQIYRNGSLYSIAKTIIGWYTLL